MFSIERRHASKAVTYIICTHIHMSHVISHIISHIYHTHIYDISYIIYHISYLIYHMSYVICHMYIYTCISSKIWNSQLGLHIVQCSRESLVCFSGGGSATAWRLLVAHHRLLLLLLHGGILRAMAMALLQAAKRMTKTRTSILH